MLRTTLICAAAAAMMSAPVCADDVRQRTVRTPASVALALDSIVRDSAATAPEGTLALLPFRLQTRELGVLDPSTDIRPLSRSCAGEICDRIATRTALGVDAEDWTVSIGAQARIIDRLDSLVEGGGRSSWYVFIAADAQAMSWSLGDRHHGGDDEGAPVHLDDMRLVGDAQAGVGARLAGGDLAIGYVTREVSHLGAERRESFVGVTFGWEG